LYASYEWFKKYVDEENNSLLLAIQSKNKKQTDSLITAFFKVRDKRRSQTRLELKRDIIRLEKGFESMEGTARFMEAYALEYPVPDPELMAIDSLFKLEIDYRLDESLYNTAVSQVYYYATGYNITRLLRKLKIDYVSQLFNRSALTVEDLLRR